MCLTPGSRHNARLQGNWGTSPLHADETLLATFLHSDRALLRISRILWDSLIYLM